VNEGRDRRGSAGTPGCGGISRSQGTSWSSHWRYGQRNHHRQGRKGFTTYVY